MRATGVLFFKNETADKCGRLMNGATRSKSLTAIDLAELKALVLTQWKEKLCWWKHQQEPLDSSESNQAHSIELKSLILAQIERWRHALHMQVERQHGGNPGGEWRTGE